MMRERTTLAARLTRAWVRIYTSGLAAEARDARQAEIESDLWEHENGSGADPSVTGWQVLSRLLLGVPADLSWRLDAWRRSGAAKGMTILGRTKSAGAAMLQNVPLGLTVLVAGIYIAGGVAFMVEYASGSLDYEASALDAVLDGPIAAAAAAMILLGLFMSKQRPWLGAGVLTIGAAALPAVHPWFFPIDAPLLLVIIACGIARARRFARERDRMAPA